MRIGSEPPTSDHAQEDHDDGDHQQDVDDSAHGVRGDKAKNPEHKKNDDYGFEHGGLLGFSVGERVNGRVSNMIVAP